MTVMPGKKGTAGIEEVPDPGIQDGALLVRGMAVGICGTDREIAEGAYGTPPSGEARLVIGHESLGEVLEAPAGSGFAPGDLVVGIVRRPDPMPCPPCAAGEWDMCRNDSFGERGIVRLHGYGSEHWRVEPDFAVPILPRLGELGVLLACLLGAQRGYEMHVVDLAQAGQKRDLVEDLGARYHSGDAADIDVDVDVVIECTGLGAVGRSAARRLASGGIMCLTGIMNLDPALDVDATALNRNMVLRNQVLVGTVNAGRRHWEQAAEALATADPGWLGGLITRRVPLTSWTEALDRQLEDIKVVVDLTA